MLRGVKKIVSESKNIPAGYCERVYVDLVDGHLFSGDLLGPEDRETVTGGENEPVVYMRAGVPWTMAELDAAGRRALIKGRVRVLDEVVRVAVRNGQTVPESVDAAVDRLGQAGTAEGVRSMVRCIGSWDGRIGSRVRQWAGEPYDYRDPVRAVVHSHPAHVDDIAQEVMKRGW